MRTLRIIWKLYHIHWQFDSSDEAALIGSKKHGCRCQLIRRLEAARRANYPVYFMRHRWLPNHFSAVGRLHVIWQRTADPLSVAST